MVLCPAGLTFLQLGINVSVKRFGHTIKVSMVKFRDLQGKLAAISNQKAEKSCILQETTLLVNQGAADILVFVDTIEADKCYIITGAPGIGKSSMVWAAICEKSEQLPEKMFVCTWALQGDFRGLLILQGGVITEGAFFAGAEIGIAQMLKLLRKDERYQDAFLIFDGADNQHSQTIPNIQGGWVLVSSVGIRLKDDATQEKPAFKFHMDSWTKEEYQKALQIEGILKNIPFQADCRALGIDKANEEDWLDGKYYFCGGCARYMFSLSLVEARKKIEEALGAVSDPTALLRNTEGAQSPQSVSSLRQCFDEKYVVLSQYVTVKLRSLTNMLSSFISEARVHAPKNKAFLGWIHELNMLHLLRQCETGKQVLKMTLKSLEGPSTTEEINFAVTAEESFMTLETITSTFDAVDTLLVPESFNFGCFDAAIVKYSPQCNTLITLQATISESHSFKPEYVARLIRHLGRNNNFPANLQLWHVFVLENEHQLTQFKPHKSHTQVTISRSSRHNEAGGQAVQTNFWKAVLQSDGLMHKHTPKKPRRSRNTGSDTSSE
jgi:hypothetical protein